ncbi:hypothetical protein ABT169_04755, partial [Streptomyces sp. NPDC001616]
LRLPRGQGVVRQGDGDVPDTHGRIRLPRLRRGRDLAGSAHGPLTVGARADLAVFDVPDEAALCAAGAAACVATVLGGRLVYRRR